MMRFDFGGADIFLAYLAGDGNLQDILSHPAYQAVAEHALRYGGNMIDEQSIREGLAGRDSAFYGLSSVQENLPYIRALRAYLVEVAPLWQELAVSELRQLFPDEPCDDIIIYPIIGYDAGIGLSRKVCMSLNLRLYQYCPREFLSTVIHEAFHVVYETIHGKLNLSCLDGSASWRRLYLTMLQNEGCAVYAPLMLRERLGYPVEASHPLQQDYALLSRPEQLKPYVDKFTASLHVLETDPLSRSECMNLIFSPDRLTYRVGSLLAKRIVESHGLSALTEGIYLSGEVFYEKYGPLLSQD